MNIHPEVQREFDSPRKKLAQARRHIQTLETEIAAYGSTIRPEFSLEQFPDRYVWLHVMRPSLPLPDLIETTASDAAANLRQALDHAVSACARCNGRQDDKTYFPFVSPNLNPPRTVAQRVKEMAGNTSPAVQKYLIELKPTPADNPMLFALHALNVVDKHRKLVSLGISVDQWRGRIRIGDLPWIFLGEPVWRESDQSLAYGVSVCPHLNYAVDLGLSVRFDPFWELSHEPVAAVLAQLAGMVQAILDELLVLVSGDIAKRPV